MNTKICFAYPWATFGGCERVFINRAMAFKTFLPGVQVDFFFLSDGGGLKSFSAALKKYGLDSVASVVPSLDSSYEVVSLVDCPHLFSELNSSGQRYIVECHTPYAENRRYLSALPSECRVVATPSSRFSDLVRNEFPFLTAPVLELNNFVPWDIEEYQSREHIGLPEWTRRPILFFGRMDKLKDPIALLDAFQIIESRRKGEFLLILCGPKSVEIDVESEIVKRGLGGTVVVMPPIPFHSASSLMESVRRAGGVFVSPSRGESFGLSAAEAISSLLPPVLSDIDAHLDLVADAGDLFTFQLGDINSLASRIEYLLDNHSNTESVLRRLRGNFSAERFISDWETLLNQV